MKHLDYEWRLRAVMAERGMYSTTSLLPLLADREVSLSASQVYRLVAERPERLNLNVLMALVDILECEVGDLVRPVKVAAANQGVRRAAADGSRPGRDANLGLKRPRRARVVADSER